MKKIKNLFWVLAFAPIVGLSVLQSCKGPEDTPPTINVSPEGAQTVAAGATIDYQITAGAEEGLSKVTISPNINGSQGGNILDTTLTGNNRAFPYTYTVSTASQVGQTIQLTFTVVDSKGTAAQTVRTITVGSGAGGNIKSSTNVTLGAHENNTGSFYNTAENMVYTVAQAKNNQAKVDVIYYFGASNNATLAAPNDASLTQFTTYQLNTWTTKNATLFKKVTTDFSAANNGADLANVYTSSTATENTQATMLSQGDILAFKTIANKYGLIKVNNISPASTTGTITMDVKVQE